jgi:hypothetical protein
MGLSFEGEMVSFCPWYPCGLPWIEKPKPKWLNRERTDNLCAWAHVGITPAGEMIYEFTIKDGPGEHWRPTRHSCFRTFPIGLELILPKGGGIPIKGMKVHVSGRPSVRADVAP